MWYNLNDDIENAGAGILFISKKREVKMKRFFMAARTVIVVISWLAISCFFVYAGDEKSSEQDALFAAFDEIQLMIKEVKEAYQQHCEVLRTPLFWRCYLVTKGGFP